ncbi:hypothetical protein VDG1235_839 [Verrucomicrobiia bacterium DG1235]|nr:hypothetical protein VDG1235_839 [Verrucomicrobiae bacterium DG1235]
MYDEFAKRSGNYITTDEDPRVPRGVRVRALKSGKVSYKRWFLPLSYGHLTLRQAYEYLQVVAAPQGKIPEVIRWTEGKDSHLVKSFFYGGVDLRAHDYIHVLLGRGLLPKDEAFVIGFTMGSTNKLQSLNREVFAYIAKHYYPNAYQMDDESRSVFLDAAKLGYISDCEPLDLVDFTPYLDMTIDEVRKRVNLKIGMLEAYYRDIEQQRFLEDPATRRLLPDDEWDDCFSVLPTDSSRSFEEAAAEANRLLDASDALPEIEEASFRDGLEAAHAKLLAVLEEQRDTARACFEEISKVLDEKEHPLVQQDLEAQRWDDYFEVSRTNLLEAKERFARDTAHSIWEGRVGEEREERVWVHALLGRGASPRDRAFCRGFYDGSSNRQTTYAADLKLAMMQMCEVSGDGVYSDDMRQVYHDGARLGFISTCSPLQDVAFRGLEKLSLRDAREAIGLRMGLVESYWREIVSRRMLL